MSQAQRQTRRQLQMVADLTKERRLEESEEAFGPHRGHPSLDPPEDDSAGETGNEFELLLDAEDVPQYTVRFEQSDADLFVIIDVDAPAPQKMVLVDAAADIGHAITQDATETQITLHEPVVFDGLLPSDNDEQDRFVVSLERVEGVVVMTMIAPPGADAHLPITVQPGALLFATTAKAIAQAWVDEEMVDAWLRKHDQYAEGFAMAYATQHLGYTNVPEDSAVVKKKHLRLLEKAGAHYDLLKKQHDGRKKKRPLKSTAAKPKDGAEGGKPATADGV
ncbi:MAG: hypothetical protein V1926_00200 [Candidatus Peregrinibacteria bacterium]